MITRRTALEMSAVALGAVAVGGVVLGEHADPAVSAPSAKQDAEILNFALLLEYVQAGVLHRGAVARRADRRAKEFASTVAAQEQEHIAFLKQALGSAARKAPKLDFGDDTADAEKFSLAAFKLEDLGVAAYNAQAPNLTKGSLAAAARIVSVESRHAAWIRDLRGMNPAPDASEPSVDAQRVIDTFKGSGYVQ